MKKSKHVPMLKVGALATAFMLAGCGEDNNPSGPNGGGEAQFPVAMTHDGDYNLGICVRNATTQQIIRTTQEGMSREDAIRIHYADSQACVNQFGGSVTYTYSDGSVTYTYSDGSTRTLTPNNRKALEQGTMEQ
ncbi:MAG: hypothetical protein LBC70_01175 [Chitinispirillales bacterium]|nr:hypothetical protein [Chitinispirillales bacterium]